MAKTKPATKPATPSIMREDTEWGSRLIVRPFPDPQYVGVEISVDVTKPKPGRSAEIRTRFSSVPVPTPLRSTDVVVWMAQMNAIQEAAKQIAAEMKEKAKPRRKKASS